MIMFLSLFRVTTPPIVLLTSKEDKMGHTFLVLLPSLKHIIGSGGAMLMFNVQCYRNVYSILLGLFVMSTGNLGSLIFTVI